MIYFRHESLFTRFTAPRAASHRCRSQPEPGRGAVCDLSGDHQTLPQTATRERSRRAQAHQRTPHGQRSGIAGRSVRAARSAPRCHARTTLPDVGREDRHQGESCQHHTCQTGSGLDTKKKTLRASEQNEAARAAWGKQATNLRSEDLVFVFLPAYSPDGSPIEEAFSKVKSFLRRQGARTREALQEAIAAALDLITTSDALGWFTHCGYPPPVLDEKVQQL
jgi:hypothetical protein